jgi:1,4-dihydroxy-2-naphthoyl-CoA hydrolase
MGNKIWFGTPTPESLEWMYENTLGKNLGIKLIEIGPDFIKASMPVDERTKQPFGICHGGAYVALAEELGSIASYLINDPEKFIGVGMEINANHVKAVSSGKVTATCSPLHIKGRTHVWDVKIHNEAGDLCCISRFTCAVVPRTKL